jgi:hypothetical protein
MSMSTVHKTRVRVNDTISLEIPKGSKLLHIADQQGAGADLDFWYLTDPSETEAETRNVRVYGTGHPIADDSLDGWTHLGTVITAGGMLAWHVFLEGER